MLVEILNLSKAVLSPAFWGIHEKEVDHINRKFVFEFF